MLENHDVCDTSNYLWLNPVSEKRTEFGRNLSFKRCGSTYSKFVLNISPNNLKDQFGLVVGEFSEHVRCML